MRRLLSSSVVRASCSLISVRPVMITPLVSCSNTAAVCIARPLSTPSSSSTSTTPTTPIFAEDLPGRSSMALNELADNPGSRRWAKRVGRGEGSGKGGSAGRGQRGQLSRERLRKPWFEGGQSPLHKKTPKRGFVNFGATPLEPVNLDRITEWVTAGRIDGNSPITLKVLRDSGCVNTIKHGVKLLGDGATDFKLKLNFEVTHSSESARRAVEAAGGSVKYVYFNTRGLRAHLMPHKFDILPRSYGTPPPKKAWRYAQDGVVTPVVPFHPPATAATTKKPLKVLRLDSATVTSATKPVKA